MYYHKVHYCLKGNMNLFISIKKPIGQTIVIVCPVGFKSPNYSVFNPFPFGSSLNGPDLYLKNWSRHCDLLKG